MAEVLVSPGIQITETDRSYVAGTPIVAGAAILGPTVKGPVLVPTRVTSYADYVRRFGTTFMTTQVFDGVRRNIMQEFMTSMAAKSFFEQGGESLLVTRVANPKAFTSARSTEIRGAQGDSAEFAPFIIHTISTGEIMNSAKESDGTFTPYDTGSVVTTSEGKYTYDEDGNLITLTRDNSQADTKADGSLVKGTKENLRWEISNINEEAGTFNLTIRRGDDTDLSQIVLESYQNVSLDPLNENYIAAVIGDQHQNYVPAVDYPNVDGTTTHVEAYVETLGNYTNKSAYVWIEVLRPTYQYLANDGMTVNEDASGVNYSAYLPVAQQGAFYGGTGKVGVIYDNKVDAEGNIIGFETIDDPTGELCAYFEDIKATTKYPQTVSSEMYLDAINLMENSDDYQINIISAPGLLGEGSMTAIDSLISVATKRGDCIVPVDLVTKDVTMPTVVAEKANKFNSSYAATYWPWLQMYSSTGRLVWVPASVIIPGIYVYTDHVAAPWYAPAGTVRGSVQGVVQTAKKLIKGNRDILYKKNVNPIATFPGTGIVIYGQKTLQKKASALDRVNVRRLLIELKKRVKDMASGILFELNTAQLRNAFRTKLENYLEVVVQRRGLYGFHVEIDDSAETIDRNEFRCRIIIQPTKVIEFVYIDFTVTNTGVEFNS